MCIKPVGQSFHRLQSLAKERAQYMLLNEREEFRLRRELSIIQEGGASDIFLCLYDTMLALKECGGVFHGLIHCSFLCYVLGLSKVNPLDYELPFERFYHKNKKYFPLVGIAVAIGCKEKAAEILAQRNFTLEYRLEEAVIKEPHRFSDEDIYQKTLSAFHNHGFAWMRRYKGIEEVEKIFAKTDGKFVFQEQFFEICTQVIWVASRIQADEFRSSIVRRDKKAIEEIRTLFLWRYDEKGVELFDYLQKGMWHAVSKAYVIGLLFLDFAV
jgi:DNA polymerase III alpha subunit